MKTIAWLIAGFAMLALSGLLESIGDAGGSPGERLPLYLPALAALIGAPFCFFRGIRSAISEIIGANSDKPKAAATTARPAQRLADIDTAEAGDAFDADAAFARYMEKRAAQAAAEPVTPPAATAERQPPVTRPTFGRRAN